MWDLGEALRASHHLLRGLSCMEAGLEPAVEEIDADDRWAKPGTEKLL
jgi:hypothetical protein